MKDKSWSLFEKYNVNSKGVITNTQTGNILKKTVKGYTIGYYINGRFYSLNALRKHLVLIENQYCPF